MLAPTIHLNGSNPEQMIQDALSSRRAVEDAIEKLRLVVPNGRDYYPQGNDAAHTAASDYRAMLEKLQSVSSELMEHAQNIDAAMEARNALLKGAR